MSLPNPGMNFTPFDPLPASDLNDLVENIEALSDGSGLEDDSIAPENLVAGSGTDWAWQTWSPTPVGFSSAPAGAVYIYKQFGKTIFLSVRQPNNGTSNSTVFEIPLPVQAKTTTDQVWEVACRGVNNGNLAFPRMATISSGGTDIVLSSDASGTSWTSSGGKRIVALEMFYEID
jgi:hypothetical protein